MMTFQEAIADFKPIKAKELADLIASGVDLVAFVGRSTCPYCQRFAPKLSQVAKTEQLTIYFLNSEDVSDLAAVQDFRQAHGIVTVPGLLVSHQGHTKVVCDSSLPEAAISAFIKG